ncbi:hypothetical protein N7488_007584 [Penicillium malachiteum]|nr:hypothetical protein N7488_007584 [Penicillium malachiteum]
MSSTNSEEEMAASDDCGDVDDRDWLDDTPSIDEEILEAMSILGHQSTTKSSDLSLDGSDPQQDPQVRTKIVKVVGNRCMGPSLVHRLRVSALCPHNVIFTEENVVLVHNYNTDLTSVSRRYLTCKSRVKFCKLAKALNMERKPGQVSCRFRDCDSPILASSAFCRDLILEGACQLTESPDLGPEATINLQSQFKRASSTSWQWREISFLGKEVLSRIMNGVLEKSGMPLVVCVDMEACLRTGRIFQVAICDLEGRKLLDCQTILSREEMRRTSADPGGRDEILQAIFERKARALASADGHMSVRQVSARLRKLFPRPEEVVFISWAKSKFDLSYLRDWLEAAGYSGVLPGNDRCYLVMQDFRYNLDRILGKTTFEGGVFPLSLPIFFPVVMGEGHRLSGRNHRALIDTQQLAILVNRLAVLCQATGSARQIPDPIPPRQTKLSFARANS